MTRDGLKGISVFTSFTGFQLAKDKSYLVNVPFVILEWHFRDSDQQDGKYVSVEVVTHTGDKIVFNDGSTGVYRQLSEITEARLAADRPDAQSGLICPNGLRVSDYFRDDATGEIRPSVPDGGKRGKGGWVKGSTYYLA